VEETFATNQHLADTPIDVIDFECDDLTGT